MNLASSSRLMAARGLGPGSTPLSRPKLRILIAESYFSTRDWSVFGLDHPRSPRVYRLQQIYGAKLYSSSTNPAQTSSPFSNPGNMKPPKGPKFIPRKAAVALTEEARTFFKALLEDNPDRIGVMLNFQQTTTGEPRMVFSFDFVTEEALSSDDEGVSLELLEDGTPKSPRDSINDGLPKLYVHRDAFLKVLGATVDIDMETITPILYDREGNVMDPNV